MLEAASKCLPKTDAKFLLPDTPVLGPVYCRAFPSCDQQGAAPLVSMGTVLWVGLPASQPDLTPSQSQLPASQPL